MRLPDFSEHNGLNWLRQQMEADLMPWESGRNWNPISIDGILGTTGVDIPLDEIETAADGTLEYEGRKVVVYIRDQSVDYQPYKFHVANCDKLQSMREEGRDKRYVVSTRTNGTFTINSFKNGRLVKKGDEDELHVCKYCLRRLNYKGYRGCRYAEQNRIMTSFNLKEFFEMYVSQITKVPTETDTSAPLNDYTSDWDEVSRRYKDKMGWRCEACSIILREMPEFLDAHHIDGLRNNNRDENICALCVGCHAEQPQHQLIESTPRYRIYQQWCDSQSQ